MRNFIIQVVYFVAAISFILGLKQMSSPKSAATGIKLAGIGMLLAVGATFLFPNVHNFSLILLAIILGSVIAWIAAKKVAITAMPEMIAIYNGMGGGAAAAVAMVELFKYSNNSHFMSFSGFALAILGGLIGAVSFSGSILAVFKLRNWLKNIYFHNQQFVNSGILVAAILLGIVFYFWHSNTILILFFSASLIYGVLMTMGIGGADMPVVIALYNAFTGLAVACEGFVLNNISMIIAGTIVGSSGSLLTFLMAKAMNRSLANVLFVRFGDTQTSGSEVAGVVRSMEAEDAAIMLGYAGKVIFIPGYGMAVAQAQQKVWELASMLIDKGIEVKFAIHPVAGRMPGHMNVLLAEAGVPYDYIFDINDINNDFATTDIAIVIGANDVVNPAARTDKSSSIYGMPILNVDYAKQIFVIKRGKGKGYAGVENLLFFDDKCRMVYGDAKQVVSKMIHALKEQ